MRRGIFVLLRDICILRYRRRYIHYVAVKFTLLCWLSFLFCVHLACHVLGVIYILKSPMICVFLSIHTCIFGNLLIALPFGVTLSITFIYHRIQLYLLSRIENIFSGMPGWLSGWASAFGSGHDPRGLGSSPTWGTPQGACFSLCLCLYLSVSLMNT